MKQLIKGIKEGFKKFGDHITIIINTILLFAAYIIGIGITAIIAKLVNKKFLKTKIDKQRKTYWHELNIGKKESMSQRYRQF